MNSQYYVSKVPGSWPGVCEVPCGQDQYYYHHVEWPTRSCEKLCFHTSETLSMCIDPISGWWAPISGWWAPMLDEDLWMDVGL